MLDNNGVAEARFREAFERLKDGCPQVLNVGAAVTQNNVAKEAGRDPSALRKSRYPDLVDEIQTWVSKAPGLVLDKGRLLKLNERIKILEERIMQLEFDRDLAQSLLVQAHDRIVVLSQQNEKLSNLARPENVHILK